MLEIKQHHNRYYIPVLIKPGQFDYLHSDGVVRYSTLGERGEYTGYFSTWGAAAAVRAAYLTKLGKTQAAVKEEVPAAKTIPEGKTSLQYQTEYLEYLSGLTVMVERNDKGNLFIFRLTGSVTIKSIRGFSDAKLFAEGVDVGRKLHLKANLVG